MSDNLDTELGASYDASNAGSIDPGPSITPDDRGPNPSSERAAHIDETRAKGDQLSKELGAIWDKEHGRLLAQEARTPKPPAGLNAHEAAAWSWDMAHAPKTEQALVGSAQTELQRMIEDAKSMGVSVKLDRDGTVPASELPALREMLGKTGGDRAAQAEVLSEELRQLVPAAKSQKDVFEAVRPYAEFEQDFRARGSQAFVDAAAARGVQLVDVSNQQQVAHLAAHFYGAPLHQVAQLAGYVPAEQVRELLQQAEVQSALAHVARGRADFDELRPVMAELIQSPRWRDREGETTADSLRRAYDLAKRERARRGPGKSAVDRSLEAAYDRAQGAA